MPRLALAQYRMSSEIGENIQESLRVMEQASKRRADVLVFPELQLSPFFPQYEDFDASPYLMRLDHECVRVMKEASRRYSLISLLNIYLQEDGQKFDASILLDAAGETLGISKMVHITHAPCFYEQSYYTPSNGGFRVYDTKAGGIGVVICFDRHFPESIRACAMLGAGMVLIPTANIHGEPLDLFEWELRVAAYHNSVYIAMCNRVGREGDVTFCGRSVIIDPHGEVLLRCGEDEGVYVADLDLDLVRRTRRVNRYLELYRAEAFQT